MKNNAIKVINAYLWNGMYVFDEPGLGITKEPFVGGSSELIAELSKDEKEVTLLFSENPFPGALETKFVSRDAGGCTYNCSHFSKNQHWLCNVMFMYFENPPKTIYFQIK